jgi:hypothetical protein
MTDATSMAATSCHSVDSSATRNTALQSAIDRYLDGLPPAEKRAFREASLNMTDEKLLDSVRAYDREHYSKSRFRPVSDSVARFLDVLNRLLAGISMAIQADPAISSIAVGAVRVVIDVAAGFVGFFNKLSEMFDRFSDFLGPLAKYATSSGDKLIQESLVEVYLDLLKFVRRARAVFVDEKGARRSLVSWRVFWRLQWIPFEEEFGKTVADMQHHLNVLEHSAHAEGLRISLRVEREQKANEEGLHTIRVPSMSIHRADVF